MTTKINELRINTFLSKILTGLKPPDEITVTQWAEKRRYLSSESSAETGLWRTSRTPYLKEPMDAFTDPKVKHIVIWSSAQVGKSETINNMIGYIIDQDPGSILFINPTIPDAKDYSQLRIDPMIRDSKCLKKKVQAPKSRSSGNTILKKSYTGGILTLCGSTEAHALASKPIRYVFGDERDRWAVSAGIEGDPWELASARQITFYNAKAVEVSTPTIKGKSAIEKSYVKGTMERWCTKCPHCGEYNEIKFNDIRFEYETSEVSNAKTYKIIKLYYICPSCAVVSSENEIKKQPAKWIADNPDAYEQGTRSFKLSSWVSPWASWESTIIKYLEAYGDSTKMQVVYNTRFGELWEDRSGLEDESNLMGRREEYDAEVPKGVLCLTCGVDTQDDRLEYEVVGYGHFGENWGIKKGYIMGCPDNDETWEALDGIIDHMYTSKTGVKFRVSMTFVDEGGHYTKNVRLQCKKRANKKMFAIKGRGGSDIPYTSPPKKQKIVIDNHFIGTSWVFELGVDSGKQKIMNNLHVQTPGNKYCHFPKREDYGEIYFKGLLSEHYVYRPNVKNKFQWVKIPGHERNEALDCRNYANAAEDALAPNYDMLEQKVKGVNTTSESNVATSQAAVKPRPKVIHNKALEEFE